MSKIIGTNGSIREFISSKYSPKNVFNEARKTIKETFGLDLTLIELVRLKQYVLPVLKEVKGLNPLSTFNPIGEVATRFMVDYYGLDQDLAMIHTRFPKRVRLFIENEEAFHEYLRRKQQEYHLP